MALQSSGAISLSNVNVELLVSATAQISMNDTNVRTLAGVASGAINMTNFYSKSWRKSATYTFTTNTAYASVNLGTISGYSSGITDCYVVVSSGIYLYSDDTGSYALTITGGTTGDTLTLTNNGYIMGRGGNGPQWNQNQNHPGSAYGGGPAINMSPSVSTIYVDCQNGYIGGGGGAGGGYYSNGGGGGGGAGGGRGTWQDDGYGFQYGHEGGSVGGYSSEFNTNGSRTSDGGTGGGRRMPGDGGAGALRGGSYRWAQPAGAGGGGGSGGGSTKNASGDGGDGGNGGSAGGKGRSAQGTNQGNGGGGGGGWGASGGNLASGQSGQYEYGNYGAGGGKAMDTGGRTINWVNGSASSSRVFGGVS